MTAPFFTALGGLGRVFGIGAYPPPSVQSQTQSNITAYPFRHHPTHSASDFQSLAAYIRSLLRTEPNCQCAWCCASELERQVAIAQLFKEEPESMVAK